MKTNIRKKMAGPKEQAAIDREGRVKTHSKTGASVTTRNDKGDPFDKKFTKTMASDTKRRMRETLKGRAADAADMKAAKAAKATSQLKGVGRALGAVGTVATVLDVTGKAINAAKKVESAFPKKKAKVRKQYK